MRSLFGGRGEPSQEEMMELQTEQNLRQQAHGQMLGEDGGLSEEYVEELVSHGLNESSVRLIENLLSQDYVLSKLKDAEAKEIKWLGPRLQALKAKRLHPPADSVMTGKFRQFGFDDANDDREPLSPHQENLIDQAALAIFTRIYRSVGGWQQDTLGKQVTVTRNEDIDERRDGGLFGR